jgi:hypothetical protein
MIEYPPNCTVAGRKLYSCACGHSYEEAGAAANGHGFVRTQYTAATCAADGSETRVCVSCELVEHTVLNKLPHDFSVSSVLVSADDLIEGKPFEILSCTGCKEMKLVEANHASGHHLDANGICACGATSTEIKVPILTEDFEDKDYEISVGRTDLIANGAWKISGTDQQQATFTINASPVFNALYNGKYDEEIDAFFVNYEIYYTGDAQQITGGGWNWRAAHADGNRNYYDEFFVTFGKDGNQLTVKSFESEVYTLTENERYTITVKIEPSTQTLSTYLDGTLLGSCVAKYYDAFDKFYMSRSQLYCADDSFTLNVDSITIAVPRKYIDESKAAKNDCEHEFVAAPVEDGDWYKITCDDCGAFYYEQGCEVLGHIWGDKAIDDSKVTCAGGTATYECEFCGETEDRTADAIDHAYTRFVSVTPAEGETAGYETRMCTWCEETANVEGNHPSGHNFDENKTCACGAYMESASATLAKNDFSTASGQINMGSIEVTEEGTWKPSLKSYTIKRENNAGFVDVLDGEYNGKEVTDVTFSFEFTYAKPEGGLVATSNSFMNNTFSAGGVNKIHYPFTFEVDTETGNLKTKESSTVLTPGETYIFSIWYDVEGGATAVSYINGVEQKKFDLPADMSVANFYRIVMYGDRLCGAEVTIDNMSIDYDYNEVVEVEPSHMHE